MTNEDRNTAALKNVAELLGDLLPADWRDACAVQGRQDHLSAIACEAAEAATGWLVHAATAARCGQPISIIDDESLDELVDALERLDRGWRRYVHDTQQDAETIVRAAAEFSGGVVVADFVERSLGGLRAIRAKRIRAEIRMIGS